MKKQLKAGYKGYKSYDYLTPGDDYKVFNLATEDHFFGKEEIVPRMMNRKPLRSTSWIPIP